MSLLIKDLSKGTAWQRVLTPVLAFSQGFGRVTAMTSCPSKTHEHTISLLAGYFNAVLIPTQLKCAWNQRTISNHWLFKCMLISIPSKECTKLYWPRKKEKLWFSKFLFWGSTGISNYWILAVHKILWLL